MIGGQVRHTTPRAGIRWLAEQDNPAAAAKDEAAMGRGLVFGVCFLLLLVVAGRVETCRRKLCCTGKHGACAHIASRALPWRLQPCGFWLVCTGVSRLAGKFATRGCISVPGCKQRLHQCHTVGADLQAQPAHDSCCVHCRGARREPPPWGRPTAGLAAFILTRVPHALASGAMRQRTQGGEAELNNAYASELGHHSSRSIVRKWCWCRGRSSMRHR